MKKNETPRKNYAQWFTTTVDLPIDSFVLQEEEVEQLAWISPEKLVDDVKAHPDKYVSSFRSVLPLLLPKNVLTS